MEKMFSKLKLKLLENLDSNAIISSSFKDMSDSKIYTLSSKRKKAAVLCLLDFSSNYLNIILTLRSKKLKDHPGQISFPGGKINNKENKFECALRETNEEIGIISKNIRVLGEMNTYLSGSNFLIKPIIGVTLGKYQFSINKDEVDRVFYFPINYLFNIKNLTKSYYIDKGQNKKFFYYDIKWKGIRIWGATAIILVHLSKIINNVILKND